MADTKISALTAASAAAAANELPINEAGTSKKLTVAQVATFINPVIAGNSGALKNDIGATTHQVLTAANTDIPTTTQVIQLTGTGMGAGWWDVEYHIIWQSNVTTTGITFIPDHSGTAANSNWNRIDPLASSTALATVGIAGQNLNVAGTGSLPSTWANQADNTALGPNAGVTVINTNQVTIIRGKLLVTVSGDMTLKANSEVAATVTRVSAGTSARYTRLS